MFDGTTVKLEIFSPTLDNPIITPAKAKVDDSEVEFFNSSFFDVGGDSYNVVAARFDVVGSQLHYDILASAGTFSNVTDDTGFNGYKFTFQALSGNRDVRIINADVIGGRNTLEVPDDYIDTSRDAIFVNVDGLSFARGEDLSLQLGFKFAGSKRDDLLMGEDGRDVLVGKAGADDLYGGYGKDKLNGGSGVDLLDGGGQADVLKGGGGADYFVLRTGGGRDTVKDFVDGTDYIVLRTSERNFDALTIEEAGRNLVISADDASLVLRNVDIEDITARDFDFG